MDKSWIKQACSNVWQKILDKVKHAVVFMDYPCAECLFWNGGPMMMLAAGALEIKDFSSFENGSEKQRKAVFVVSKELKGKTLSILQDIIKASSFEYCVVFTAVDSETHKLAYALETQEANYIFQKLEEDVCMWMGNVNYTSEVIYAPVFMAPYASFLFLTPSMNKFFPLTKQDLYAIDSMRKTKGEKHSIERLSDVHFFSLPVNYQLQIKNLALLFNQLFEILSCKEELFAVGHTSRLVATQLANYPPARQRRKTAMTTASLLLVDRSLDSVAPAHHTDVSLLDKILGILPELPGHCNNISVDMLKLTTAKSLLNHNLEEDETEPICDIVSCPGCICPSDDACPQLLQDLMMLPQKEAMDIVKRNLMEACVEEGLNIQDEDSKKSFSNEVYQLVESFHGNSGAIMYHNNLLQLSMAAAQTVSDPFYEKWSRLHSMEKLLTLEEDPVTKISELLNEEDAEGKKQWTVEDILCLLVYVCSLKDMSYASEDAWDDLSSSLSLAISDSTSEELPEGLNEALGISQSETNDAELDQIQDIVEQIVEKLKDLHTFRDHLTHYRNLCRVSFGPPTYEPLLLQLFEKILNIEKPDLQPDVEHISTGLMDLLKSGFSMFKKVSQPRPNDAQVMFVFVIGGITFEEVSAVRKMVLEYNTRHHLNTQVIFGSTGISSPGDVLDKLLFATNLSPDISE